MTEILFGFEGRQSTMSTTIIYGLLVAVLILGPLIVLHEFGHFFLAKWHRVKVLEFGFGFPPRMFGIWSGKTLVSTSPDTKWEGALTGASVEAGDMVTIVGYETDEGTIEALTVSPFERQDISLAQTSPTVFVGKVKGSTFEGMTIADMVWSINWLPFGGFVKLKGEEDPSAKG